MSISIQKANFWKRVSAWLVDVVLTIVLSMAFALGTSSILNYEKIYNEYSAIVTEYEKEFGITLDQEEYDKLSETDKKAYDAKQQEMDVALSKNEKAMSLRSALSSLIFTIVAISLSLSILVAHFIIPLFFKDGKTLGKKVFGLAVIRTNGVKLSTPVLFARSIVGLLAIETLAVMLLCTMGIAGKNIIALIAALGVQILQVFVMLKTPHRASIHDLLADTVVVDFASQRIFESQEELLAAIAEEQAKEAAEAPYCN